MEFASPDGTITASSRVGYVPKIGKNRQPVTDETGATVRELKGTVRLTIGPIMISPMRSQEDDILAALRVNAPLIADLFAKAQADADTGFAVMAAGDSSVSQKTRRGAKPAAVRSEPLPDWREAAASRGLTVPPAPTVSAAGPAGTGRTPNAAKPVTYSAKGAR